MDHLPQPAARAKALLRAFDLGAVYPEGASVGEDDRFYTHAVAVLLEAAELARELREKDTGRLFLGNARLAVGQVIGRHTAEEEVAGIFLSRRPELSPRRGSLRPLSPEVLSPEGPPVGRGRRGDGLP